MAIVQKELDAAENFLKHVRSICEFTNCDEETAKDALTKANGNIDAAVESILTGGQGDAIDNRVSDVDDDEGDWAQACCLLFGTFEAAASRLMNVDGIEALRH